MIYSETKCIILASEMRDDVEYARARLQVIADHNLRKSEIFEFKDKYTFMFLTLPSKLYRQMMKTTSEKWGVQIGVNSEKSLSIQGTKEAIARYKEEVATIIASTSRQS